MQTTKNIHHWFFIFTTLLLLSGCKTPVVGLQHHPSFTYDSISQQRFVIAGVVSSIQPMQESQRLYFASLLERTFRNERPEIFIHPAGMLRKHIGKQEYEHLLQDYRITGVLDISDIQNIRQSFNKSRYLILCRIQKDQVFQDMDETETDVADSKDDEEKGEYEYLRVDISLNTTRLMEANLLIYDMQQHITAWSGSIESSQTHSNHSSHTYKKEGNWKHMIARAFLENTHDDYPTAPSQEKVLRQIFQGFAENMPKIEH